jgi:hypothetical protein
MLTYSLGELAIPGLQLFITSLVRAHPIDRGREAVL